VITPIPPYRQGVKRLLVLVVLVALAMPASAAGRSREITWHGNQIHMYDAQAPGRDGAGVVVAVLDGWIDRAHPDFEGRVLPGADCTSGTCVAGQTRDPCTHGTHVAGTVASSSFGVAPKATILPVRVLTDNGSGDCTGTPDNVAAGIRWATAQGARVMNLSLGASVPGVSKSKAIPDAVSDAAAAGIVVIFSAGNADLPLADSYGNNALVVAATGPSGQLASYSQYGSGVDVAAPGGQPSGDNCSQATCVTSLYPDGRYAVAAGTSMAAPHVSGIAALLLGQSPSRSRSSILSRIKQTAHPLAGAGSGLVDARAALGATATKPRPTTTTTRAPVVVHPKPKPKPTPVATTARPSTTTAPKPSRTAVAPVPVATTTAPAVVVPPLAVPLAPAPDDIPLPLALLAAALVALGVVGVAAASRPRS
jgi:subtilisin family serine protease